MPDRPHLEPLDGPLVDDALRQRCAQIAARAAAQQRPRRLAGSGHKWCVRSCEQAVRELRELGIACRAVQAPDWHHRIDDDEQGRPRFATREDCGFTHPDGRDPSHTWIELADGTIIDPTISQFRAVKDWPKLRGLPSVAVIAPGDAWIAHYHAEPLPGHEQSLAAHYPDSYRL